jgi:ankyrin repeat protein
MMIHLLRLVASASLMAAFLAAGICDGAAAPAAPAATCRELEGRFEALKAGMVSGQLNAMLFQAADAGCVPLARAARVGHIALIELFLSRGAAIDARNLTGTTALYGAAENERHGSVALLLAKGADPNLAGPSGVAPLAAAAFKGNGRVVDLLLARGADPNAVDATGKSAMTYAAARGFALIVRRLLAAGVDPRRAYGNDLTALMWAAGHEEGVGARAALDVVELLLEAGAPIDAADNRGRTALMMAAEIGDADVVEHLLGRGADPAIADKSGKRALDLAANDGVRAKLAAR